jgi:archaellum component FlaC
VKAWPDWDEFVRRLREDPVFREEVRRQVLTEDLLNLPAVVQAGLAHAAAQIAALTEQVRENGRQIAALTEALREFREAAERRFAAAEAQIAENSRQIAALTERMERAEAQIQENGRQIAENSRQIAMLTEQVRENSRQIAALAEALREFREAADRRFAALERDVRDLKQGQDRLEGQVGHLMGRDFESQFRKMASAVFRGGGDLRSALHRALSAVKVDLLSPEEHLRLRKLDFLWGRGGTVFVGEVSEAVGEDDVLRVRWSVEILRRLGWGRGLRLLPVVVGRSRPSPPEDLAWIQFDPKAEVMEVAPQIETILREEGPEPVEPERFFGEVRS